MPSVAALPPAAKPALTPGRHWTALLATLPTTRYRGCSATRTAHCVLFAWSSGGRRRTCRGHRVPTLENTRRDGDSLWSLHSGSIQSESRGGVDRPENEKPTRGRPQRFRARCVASRTSGTSRRPDLPTHLARETRLASPSRRRRSAQYVCEARCVLAGLTGDFSGPLVCAADSSLKAGKQNIPLGDTMAMTGHASVATIMRYFRAGQVRQRSRRAAL